MSRFPHHTMVVTSNEEEEMRPVHAEAVRRFGDRVSAIVLPKEGNSIAHASFFIAPSGRKNDEGTDLAEFCAWLHEVDQIACPEFVRCEYDFEFPARVLDYYATEDVRRCPTCKSTAMEPDCMKYSCRKVQHYYCHSCGEFDETKPPLAESKVQQQTIDELVERITMLLRAAPPERNGLRLRFLHPVSGRQLRFEASWVVESSEGR